MARAARANPEFARRLSALFDGTPGATDISIAAAITSTDEPVSRQYIGKLRRGEEAVAPSLTFTARLCKHFGVGVEYFLEDQADTDRELVLDLLRASKQSETRRLRRLLRVAALLNDADQEAVIADAARRAALSVAATIDLTGATANIPDDVKAALRR